MMSIKKLKKEITRHS